MMSDTSPTLGHEAEPSRLSQKHLDDLRKSGLSDETIAACKFATIRDSNEVKRILKWKNRDARPLGEALGIPYFRPDGSLIPAKEFARLKPNSPRPNEDGKPVKYESPIGSGMKLYLPPWINLQLQDVSAPLHFTEGEKKAAKAAQEGFACVGLGGVWSWVKPCPKGADGKRTEPYELHPDFDAIALTGREVFIEFDSDLAENPKVQKAELEFGQCLIGRGAVVRLVRLPNGPPDATGKPTKVGLDDYLVTHSADEFRELLKSAQLLKPKGSLTVEEAADDPHRLARIVVHEFPNLRYWRGEFYRYSGQCYQRMPPDEVCTMLTASIKREFDRINQEELENWQPSEKKPEPPSPQKVTRSLVGDVQQALQSLCQIHHVSKLDSWLDESTGSFIAVENGIVDINRAAVGESECLSPHSPNWFSLVVLPYAFDAAATCPRWLAFLAKNLEGDAERTNILQEWFGLSLVADTSYQKFLLMVGEGANGKSVACAVLTALLGAANVSNVPLEGFGERFQLNQTVGKLANIAAEVGEVDKVAEGHLKAFTSGDRMQFERKYRDPVELTPTARLVLATNNLPYFADRSGGVWRRMILMPFRVTIPVVDRIIGMDKPEWWLAQGELPGIFLWALAGLKRLREQESFTKSAVCEAALAEYRGDCNPAATFLRENYREHPNGFLTTFELYTKYRDWCAKHRHDKPLGERTFGKEIVRTFPKAQRRNSGPRGQRAWGYSGICEGGIES